MSQSIARAHAFPAVGDTPGTRHHVAEPARGRKNNNNRNDADNSLHKKLHRILFIFYLV
jgi:hypothetical protein